MYKEIKVIQYRNGMLPGFHKCVIDVWKVKFHISIFVLEIYPCLPVVNNYVDVTFVFFINFSPFVSSFDVFFFRFNDLGHHDDIWDQMDPPLPRQLFHKMELLCCHVMPYILNSVCTVVHCNRISNVCWSQPHKISFFHKVLTGCKIFNL